MVTRPLSYKIFIILMYSISSIIIITFSPQYYTWGYDYHYCSSAINFYENQYKLPKHLLWSIATVESGQLDKMTNKVMPTPWTLNIQGKPYYFKTKAEALKSFKKALAQGIENIDVGCAQINWYYHGKYYFKKPELALNPVFNVGYAAYLLAKNHLETSSWIKAIAIYHSKTDKLGMKYAAKVYKTWYHTHKTSYKSKALTRNQNQSSNNRR